MHETEKKEQYRLNNVDIGNLIYECSYNFIVNHGFDKKSKAFKIINEMNSDPSYQ